MNTITKHKSWLLLFFVTMCLIYLTQTDKDPASSAKTFKNKSPRNQARIDDTQQRLSSSSSSSSSDNDIHPKLLHSSITIHLILLTPYHPIKATKHYMYIFPLYIQHLDQINDTWQFQIFIIITQHHSRSTTNPVYQLTNLQVRKRLSMDVIRGFLLQLNRQAIQHHEASEPDKLLP